MPSWSTPQCLFCQRKSFKSTHKSICRSVWKYRSPLLRGPFFRPNAEHPLGDGFGSCRNGRATLEMRVIGGLQEKVCAQQCLTVDLKGKLYGLCGIGVDCEATVHSSLVSNVHSQSLFSFYYCIYLRDMPYWIPVLYISCWKCPQSNLHYLLQYQSAKIFQSSWNNVI